MKVSLVYPGIVGKGFDSIGQGMDSGWISHGLAILGACAGEAGHDVNLIDLRALKGWDPVSYTHLDVYKRQAVTILSFLPSFFI